MRSTVSSRISLRKWKIQRHSGKSRESCNISNKRRLLQVTLKNGQLFPEASLKNFSFSTGRFRSQKVAVFYRPEKIKHYRLVSNFTLTDQRQG